MLKSKIISLTKIFSKIQQDIEKYRNQKKTRNSRRNIGSCLDKVQTIISFLSTKQVSAFRYEKWDYESYPKHDLLGDLKRATYYSFDENVLGLIISVTKNTQINPRGLIELLVKTGIAERDTQCGYSSFLYGEMSKAKDDDLYWYIGLGFALSPYLYREYGHRSDRSFHQKIKMFEMLSNKYGLKTEINIVSDCYEFSNDIKEVKKFIDWFLSKRYSQSNRWILSPVCSRRNDYDFGNSFIFFGTDLFEFLLERHIRPNRYSIQFIVQREGKSIKEKIDALNKIKNLMNECPIDFNTLDVLSDAVNLESMDLIELLMSIGASPSELFLEKLLTSYDGPSIGFTKSCIQYMLDNGVEIPHVGKSYQREDFCQFHERDYYHYPEIYDWLMATQPKMNESANRRVLYLEHLRLQERAIKKADKRAKRIERTEQTEQSERYLFSNDPYL